jgi:enterochelin esterase-like enzyme
MVLVKFLGLVVLVAGVYAVAQSSGAAKPLPQHDWSRVVSGTKTYPLGVDSAQHPEVPVGRLSSKVTITSKIYDGMVSDYWVYQPAQYDASVPAAVMIFQDGSGYLDRKGDHPALNVIDNLIAQHKIPVMICIFVNPGKISTSPDTPTYRAVKSYGEKYGRTLDDSMRSVEYDTVSDRYARFLRDELLPEVGAHYSLRKDAYSTGITGLSSGGIAAFNAAWQMPEQFSRVIVWIGSFTSLQWHEDPAVPDGGQDFAAKVLHEPHRNLRVWLQDGSNDQENPVYGSWPLHNIALANALKLKGYDFGFTFGEGNHSVSQGASEFPAEMTWLWRDYDPAAQSAVYMQDPAEASRPPFRVTITNRSQSPLDR